MEDTTPEPEPPNHCHACGNPLNEGASRCGHCAAFQDWRFKMNSWLPIAGLIIGVISIAPISVNAIFSILYPPKAEIKLSEVKLRSEGLAFFIFNAGEARGWVEPIVSCSVPKGFAGAGTVPDYQVAYKRRTSVPANGEVIEVSDVESVDLLVPEIKESNDVYLFGIGEESGLYGTISLTLDSLGLAQPPSKIHYRCKIFVEGSDADEVPTFDMIAVPDGTCSTVVALTPENSDCP